MQIGKAVLLAFAAVQPPASSPALEQSRSPVTIEIHRAPLANASGEVLRNAVRASTLRFAGFLAPGGRNPALELRRKRAAAVELVNNMNLLYAAPVTLGNGQRFNVHIDTGSADTWLRGPNCQSRDRSCVGTRVDITDPTLTSTSRSFQVQYGSGAVAGQIYRGSMVAGGASSSPLYFGVSTEESGFDDQGYTDGLMGLAYDSISNIRRGLGGGVGTSETNFFDQMKFGVGERRFGVYLSNARDGDRGELTLGGDNPRRYTGPVNCIPLVQTSFWAFSLAGSTFQVGNIQSALGGSLSYAIADTGTTLAILDDGVAANINRAIGGIYDFRYGVYLVNCGLRNGGPQVMLNIGGYSFAVPPTIYVLEDPSGLCFSGFTGGASGGAVAILGDTFLRAYYSIYDKDNSRVCFAKAVHG
ncbi:hypothetical protein HDU67_008078 [Dinochytrium kinnereticum]|nr:hypothetical protein HDU67_008078 [Dinochytrium kinnereticum]